MDNSNIGRRSADTGCCDSRQPGVIGAGNTFQHPQNITGMWYNHLNKRSSS